MMSGPWAAKTLVTEYLASDLPTRLVRFRNAMNLDDRLMPDPMKYLQYEPLALDYWPTIITLISSTIGVTREDYDEDSNPMYRVKYAARTYVWVRADGGEDTTMVRDNLTTVVRDALLDHPALRSVDRTDYCEPYIEESTLREEFSELTLLKGERMLAGSYIAYDLEVTEKVTREALSTSEALQYVVTVETMSKLANSPTLLIAIAGTGEASLTWHAPTWDGGLYAVSGYQIEQSTDAGQNWAVAIGDTGSTHPNYTVTGLTAGDTYMFRVSAINDAGVGAASAPSNSVTVS